MNFSICNFVAPSKTQTSFNVYIQEHFYNETLHVRKMWGSGASGRVTAFSPSKPGSNPVMDLAFFGNAINLFSLGVGLFLKNGS